MYFKLVSYIFVLVFLGCCSKVDSTGFDQVGLTTAQIVRLHGYRAEVHVVPTQPGYAINLVHVINPLIKRPTKNAVIFIHGISTTASCYITNSEGGRPKDYSDLSAANMSIPELNELLAEDESARSIPFLMSNFGHDIWLFNRRATPESVGVSPPRRGPLNTFSKIFERAIKKLATSVPKKALLNHRDRILAHESDLSVSNDKINSPANLRRIARRVLKLAFKSSIFSKNYNRHYWNFGIQEQAVFDLPVIVDYVIEHSSRHGFSKVSLIGHSLGGAMCMVALSEIPSLADKITNSAMLAPAVNLGPDFKRNLVTNLGVFLIPVFLAYQGPISSPLFQPNIANLAIGFCSDPLLNITICHIGLNGFLGVEMEQLNTAPLEFSSILSTTSAHELVQLLQSVMDGQLGKINYLNPVKNQVAYSSLTAPKYDFSRIKSRHISIWTGNTDNLVPPAAARSLIKRLKVPVENRYITGEHVLFNHVAYLLHNNVTLLQNVPLLKSLHTPLSEKFVEGSEVLLQDDDYFNSQIQKDV